VQRSKAFGVSCSNNARELLVEGLVVAHQTLCIYATYLDPGMRSTWRYGWRFDGLKPWDTEISVRTYRAAGGSRVLRLLEVDPGADSITPAEVKERSVRSLGWLACGLPSDDPATRLNLADVSDLPRRYCDAHNKLLGTYPNTNTHRVALLARYVCDQIRERSNKAGKQEATFLAWNLITLAWCFRKFRHQGFNCICQICFRRTEAGQQRCPLHTRCDADPDVDSQWRVSVRQSLSLAARLQEDHSWTLLRHELQLVGVESVLLPRTDYLDDLAGDVALEILLNMTPKVKAIVGDSSCPLTWCKSTVRAKARRA
jgi:hypothetical protein